MTEVSPCKDCAERFQACSVRCPKDARGQYGYKAWKARCQAEKQHLEDNKYRFNIPMTAAREKRDTHYINHPVTGYKGGKQ